MTNNMAVKCIFVKTIRPKMKNELSSYDIVGFAIFYYLIMAKTTIQYIKNFRYIEKTSLARCARSLVITCHTYVYMYVCIYVPIHNRFKAVVGGGFSFIEFIIAGHTIWLCILLIFLLNLPLLLVIYGSTCRVFGTWLFYCVPIARPPSFMMSCGLVAGKPVCSLAPAPLPPAF